MSQLQSAKIISETRLVINGFLYFRSKEDEASNKIYWDCRRVRDNECKARAITSFSKPGSDFTILKGPRESLHEHLANPEEAEAEEIHIG